MFTTVKIILFPPSVKNWDVNGDGRLDYSEFTSFMFRQKERLEKRKIENAIEGLGATSDGRKGSKVKKRSKSTVPLLTNFFLHLQNSSYFYKFKLYVSIYIGTNHPG